MGVFYYFSGFPDRAGMFDRASVLSDSIPCLVPVDRLLRIVGSLPSILIVCTVGGETNLYLQSVSRYKMLFYYF
jgi:hypothetical protein